MAKLILHRQPIVNAVVKLRVGEVIVPVRGPNKGGGAVPEGWTNPFPASDWSLSNRGDGRGNMTP